ncbi:hypothetical protein J0B03_04940 [Alkalibacter rhizosphaerae]|uniref:VWA-like domain-containing protein n=1 Tax=Alkalibacter rhizosphaerae TaxID=2815577 RepID=A0A975AJ65_9FIRM|nr:VWA-like domain-containing protein [Alkalibacter rhizosphaerae]QSX09414.1 hypothetical protein J0B03_04940 [Alkalibacter rhizosphaerae]
MDAKEERMEILALELLQDARDSLVLSLRFLDRALHRCRWTPVSEEALGTNTMDVYFQPRYLLKKFKEERNEPARDLLHMVLHCILAHPFTADGKNKRHWDLACDMVVEDIILQLQLGMCRTYRDGKEKEVLEQWKKRDLKGMAENIYHHLEETSLEEEETRNLETLFFRDHHDYWKESKGFGRMDEWKQLSQQVKTDLETYSKALASRSDGLIQNLRQVHRDRINYEAFLRKFAVLHEEMKINDDEFDYVFYTYGMELYGNMPLVEPLEYAEETRIRDFVIALDTSGSCSGELIQSFLEKTYSILQNTGSFFQKVNIYIVMSDNKVQQVTHITSTEEFNAYLKDLQIIGLGGTDFRPVFEYVDQLVETGALENLKGLIYFTDGYGRFPGKKPDYDTAFVFLEEEEGPQVPSWAIKITLGEQELKR